MKKPTKPLVLAAAVRVCGRTFIGRSHQAILREIEETTYVRHPPMTAEMGFAVSHENAGHNEPWLFVDRVEALRIAIAAGQVSKEIAKEPDRAGRLFSDDITAHP
jgi:hypothetical protein